MSELVVGWSCDPGEHLAGAQHRQWAHRKVVVHLEPWLPGNCSSWPILQGGRRPPGQAQMLNQNIQEAERPKGCLPSAWWGCH